jgi:hypothetical protein
VPQRIAQDQEACGAFNKPLLWLISQEDKKVYQDASKRSLFLWVLEETQH